MTDDPRIGEYSVHFNETSDGGGSFKMSFDSPNTITGVPVKRPSALPPSIKSQNFEEFIKDHPDETEQYLRPLLQSLRCEKLLYSHDMAVFQLFPELFKPDVATVSAVKELASKLDSDSAEDRAAALATIKGFGPTAIAALAEIDPQTLSPQQSASIALLIKDRLTDQQVAELSTDKDFLVECLKDSRKPVRAAALAMLQKVVGRTLEFNLDAEASQRADAAEKLRSQLFSQAP
jgi:hypothetical protein